MDRATASNFKQFLRNSGYTVVINEGEMHMATINKEEMAVKTEVVNDEQPEVVTRHKSTNADHISSMEKTSTATNNIVMIAILAGTMMTFVGFGFGYVIGHMTAYDRRPAMMNGSGQYRYDSDTRRGMMYQNSSDATNNGTNNN